MPAAIKTAFTEQFNIQLPIVSAPMFLVSTTRLVVATSEAGGLGTFPALNYRPIERYLEAIREIKSQTAKPFGINIIVQKANRYQHEQLEKALEEKVPLIITSLGSPKDVIRRAHQAGSKVYCDVIGLEHAKKVADYGADGLIAVGTGAGGHAGPVSAFALIPYLKRNLSLPILAAGSIVDGRGMLAALALGADGIYMGTRFIASKEAEVSEDYKRAIIAATPEDIVNTDRVDGFPGNFIKNEALEKMGLEKSLVEDLLARSQKIKRWVALARAGRSLLASDTSRVSYKTVFSAGQGVGLIDSVLSVREIMDQTIKEYFELKAQLP